MMFAACGAVAIWFVATYSVNVPYADEWQFPPYMAGRLPVTPTWLWTPHNEHRIPLTRGLYVLTTRIGGNDFRSGAWLNVVLLILLAALLILIARRVRGETRITDLFFPLIVLHLAHAENMLWGMEIGFVCAPLFLGIMLGLILTQPHGPRRPGLQLVAVICLTGLTLCGSHGVILVPFLSLWLILAGVSRRSGSDVELNSPAKSSLGCILSGVAGCVLTALYFYGLGTLAQHATQPQPLQVISTAAQFLAMGLSRQLANYWPWSGYVAPGLLASTGFWLLCVWKRNRAERIRTTGLLLMAAGLAALAAAIGWGRAPLGFGSGFTLRYATLAMPVLWLAYFVAVAYTTGRPRKFLQWSLLLLVGGMYYWNIGEGMGYAEPRRRAGLALEQDLRTGVSAAELADRNANPFFGRAVTLAKETLIYRSFELGPFQPAAVDANLGFFDLPIEPHIVQKIDWKAPRGRTLDQHSGLTFRLDRPRLLRRLYLSLMQTGSEPRRVPVRVLWPGGSTVLGKDERTPIRRGSTLDESNIRYLESREATASQLYEFTFPVETVTQEFHLQFGREECEFTLLRISALAGMIPSPPIPPPSNHQVKAPATALEQR